MRKKGFFSDKASIFLYGLAGLLAVLLVLLVRTPRSRQPYYQPRRFPMASLQKAETTNFSSLKKKVQEYIEEQPGVFGVYFWDLTTGNHFGINEKEPLPAASSIKVPVALYLYHQVAEKKISLDEQMAYNPDTDWSGGAGTIRWNATPGQKFTLRELAEKLIRESDNVAWKMLYRRLGKDKIAAFMKSLGGKTVFPNGENYSTAEDLALYTRAALDFANRNPDIGWILIDDMVQSIYKDGLPSYLPSDVKVGHKVGALPAVATDVGIVFLPDRPYILSVMTKDVGASEDPGFLAIGEISRLVYTDRSGKTQTVKQ
ncbi:MAG: serine hydrolase [bacterium]|jgi:beta-lactamase class A